MHQLSRETVGFVRISDIGARNLAAPVTNDRYSFYAAAVRPDAFKLRLPRLRLGHFRKGLETVLLCDVRKRPVLCILPFEGMQKRLAGTAN